MVSSSYFRSVGDHCNIASLFVNFFCNVTNVIIIIIDDTNENVMDTINVPNLIYHSVDLPSGVIDPSVKSFPTDAKKSIFVVKNIARPNNSTCCIFSRQNDTMNTNKNRKYFMKPLDFGADIFVFYILSYVYLVKMLTSGR